MDIPKRNGTRPNERKGIENKRENAKNERRAARPASSRPSPDPTSTRSIVHPRKNGTRMDETERKETMKTNDGRQKGRVHYPPAIKRDRKRLDRIQSTHKAMPQGVKELKSPKSKKAKKERKKRRAKKEKKKSTKQLTQHKPSALHPPPQPLLALSLPPFPVSHPHLPHPPPHHY
jgi:hypothetical protein